MGRPAPQRPDLLGPSDSATGSTGGGLCTGRRGSRETREPRVVWGPWLRDLRAWHRPPLPAAFRAQDGWGVGGCLQGARSATVALAGGQAVGASRALCPATEPLTLSGAHTCSPLTGLPSAPRVLPAQGPAGGHTPWASVSSSGTQPLKALSGQCPDPGGQSHSPGSPRPLAEGAGQSPGRAGTLCVQVRVCAHRGVCACPECLTLCAKTPPPRPFPHAPAAGSSRPGVLCWFEHFLGTFPPLPPWTSSPLGCPSQ